jgi:hypothetical protein
VLEKDGRIVGFALCRPFGRGRTVGPIVASDDATSIALAHPHIAAHAGTFLRVDTGRPNGAFAQFLDDAGMAAVDTVVTMLRGNQEPQAGPARIYGLANQALG